MIQAFKFRLFTVNLGPFPGGNCPDVRLRLSVADRLTDAAAVLIVLLGWAGAWTLHRQGTADPQTWLLMGAATLVCALMLTAARMPVRYINFPVRVGAHNVARQYVLAVRLVRVFNVSLCLLFAAGQLASHHTWAAVLTVVSLVLLGLSLVAYYVLALRLR